MPLYFLSGYPVSDCSLVHYGCEIQIKIMLNVSCVIFNMCKFQWRLMSLPPGGVCYGLRVSQLHSSVCKTTLLSSLQNCLISFLRLQREEAIFVLWLRRLQFAQLVHGGLETGRCGLVEPQPVFTRPVGGSPSSPWTPPPTWSPSRSPWLPWKSH